MYIYARLLHSNATCVLLQYLCSYTTIYVSSYRCSAASFQCHGMNRYFSFFIFTF